MNHACKLNCDHVLRNTALKLAALAKELEKLAKEIDREPDDEPTKNPKRVPKKRRKPA